LFRPPGYRAGVALLDDFRHAGFREARIVRRCRDPRSANPDVIVAEIVAAR
jgi:hypothetical protein